MSLEGGKGLVKEKKNGLNILQIGAFFIFLEVLQSVEEWQINVVWKNALKRESFLKIQCLSSRDGDSCELREGIELSWVKPAVFGANG